MVDAFGDSSFRVVSPAGEIRRPTKRMGRVMAEIDRLVSWRVGIMGWLMAVVLWSGASMAKDIGRREAMDDQPAALSDTKADRMARTWLGLMQYHAQRMENQ